MPFSDLNINCFVFEFSELGNSVTSVTLFYITFYYIPTFRYLNLIFNKKMASEIITTFNGGVGIGYLHLQRIIGLTFLLVAGISYCLSNRMLMMNCFFAFRVFLCL